MAVVQNKGRAFKVLVVGAIQAGKTCILKRWVHLFFSSHSRPSIGIEFYHKHVAQKDGTTIRLMLCDIAGSVKDRRWIDMYYRDANGAFVVFDVSDPISVTFAERWKQDIDRNVQLPNGMNIPVVLLANKSDLKSEASVSHLDQYWSENGYIGGFKTSAKHNTGIEEAITLILTKMMENAVYEYASEKMAANSNSDVGVHRTPASKMLQSNSAVLEVASTPAKNTSATPVPQHSTEALKNVFKIIVVGNCATGKTSIVRRYIQGVFSSEYTPTDQVKLDHKNMHFDDDTSVHLELWDVSGQERARSRSNLYYNGAVGAFAVFDVTNKKSFDDLSLWKAEIDRKALLPGGGTIPVFLLANKWDMISSSFFVDANQQLDDFCRDKGFIGWFKTSAKDNLSLDGAAKSLILKIFENDAG